MMRAPRLLFAAVAFLAMALPAAAQNEVTDRFSRTSHLDQDGTFDLTNVYGTIVLTGGTGHDVTIEAVKRVQRPNANAARALLQMIDIQVTEGANRIEVRTVVPRPRNFPGSVDYMVTLPQDARVTVRTMSGNIRATNIRGELLKSVSGDIEIVGGSADDVITASTVSGNIAVRGLRGRTTQLTTVTGNVRVDDLQADRLAVRAVNGNIDYAGDVARSGRYEFVTHSGDIRLTLSGATGFEVQANSLSGTVRSDFPITRRSEPGAEGRRGGVTARGLRGAFGDASAMLVLRAFSGNISVNRR
jgi:putative adhesin